MGQVQIGSFSGCTDHWKMVLCIRPRICMLPTTEMYIFFPMHHIWSKLPATVYHTPTMPVAADQWWYDPDCTCIPLYTFTDQNAIPTQNTYPLWLNICCTSIIQYLVLVCIPLTIGHINVHPPPQTPSFLRRITNIHVHVCIMACRTMERRWSGATYKTCMKRSPTQPLLQMGYLSYRSWNRSTSIWLHIHVCVLIWLLK